MPSRGGARARTAVAALVAAALAALALASCAPAPSPYICGKASDRKELGELFSLLRKAAGDPRRRFAVLRRISFNLTRQREYGRLAALLTSLGDDDASRPFGAWCLFTAARAYEEEGSAPIAAIYYDRVLRHWPDVAVDGEPIHRECIARLVALVESPERRIGYYKEYLARFPQDDPGRYLFLLAKEYERLGEWEPAVKTYSEYLPFFGTEVPGYPDAFRYARGVVDFYNSPKDWACADLQTLVARLRSALASRDAERLRSYRAKVNFFASSWDGEDRAEGRGVIDLGPFMSGGRVEAAPEVEMGEGEREAYLKTWGWADKITTWYFYFRRIFFPANPNVHGSWEWAGIYFGERTP